MIFDSNIRINKKNYDLSLKKLKSQKKIYGIKNAICLLCSKNKNYNIIEFAKIFKNYKEFFPAVELKKKVSSITLKQIQDSKIKLVKIHPRHMGVHFSKKNFYSNLVKKIKKFNFIIMWCTLDSWHQEVSSSNEQLNLLAKIIKNTKKNKFFLMHGGGPDLLKYYEKFRFNENVFIDLSYTIYHYKKTSLEKDIIFLFNKFDKRLITGTDFPDINFKDYYKNLRRLILKSKINKKKINNILFNNLKKSLINL
mgnify:CR=1 FL=1|tara:strand:+ start:1395 stop:2150 length:756 start_codon:yes stop_codon:yes gene_type:complete